MDDKEILHKRLDAYEQEVKHRISSVRKNINNNKYRGDQADNVWLESFAKGTGLDVCCGHLCLENAEGVDAYSWKNKAGCGNLGPLCYTRVEGDDLSTHRSNELDFVISNYLEVFPSPLKALDEWYRVLRTGGIVALVISNSDAYTNHLGPFGNSHRASVFTPSTITFYLRKAGFINVVVECVGDKLRVHAIK